MSGFPQAFVQIIDSFGFDGLYRQVHVPMNFVTRRNKRFGFVDFVSVDVAARFMKMFQPDGLIVDGALWCAFPARIQGKDGNIAEATTRKKRRVRNKLFTPFLLDEAEG